MMLLQGGGHEQTQARPEVRGQRRWRGSRAKAPRRVRWTLSPEEGSLTESKHVSPCAPHNPSGTGGAHAASNSMPAMWAPLHLDGHQRGQMNREQIRARLSDFRFFQKFELAPGVITNGQNPVE